MVQPIVAAVLGAGAGAGLLPAQDGQLPPEYRAASAPSHVVEAIRIELKKIVDDPDLENRLDELGRIANQSCDLLSCLKSPEAVMRHEHRIIGGMPVGGGLGGGMAMAAPGNAETYGAQILRQLVPALMEYQRASKETPERLTEALATARREGMTDVADELEKKLLGKVLDGSMWDGGKKPIAGPPTVDDYLQDALPKSDQPGPVVGSGG